MKKIGIIFGGDSAEYEVSLKSTVAIMEEVKDMDYELVTIGITTNGKWYKFDGEVNEIKENTWFLNDNCQEVSIDLAKGNFFLKETNEQLDIDVLFPILHGGFGENGSIQGIFEMMNLPYVGCGVTASAISMNKMMLHDIADSIGIKSTPSIILTSENSDEELNDFIAAHGFPIYVKPNEAGSSKGISRVTCQEELKAALAEDSLYDTKILIQKEVKGIEIGCSIIGNQDLVVGECDQISLVEGFFDYEEKYNLITAQIILPAKIESSMTEKVKLQAKKLYEYIGCTGLARIDFFVSNQGELFLNEINTMPGFTKQSRYPMMMNEIGLSYQDIIKKLINLAEENHETKLLNIN